MRQWPKLYSKTATGAINWWLIAVDGGTVIMKWGQVGTDSPQIDSYEAKPKNVGRANETTAEEQAEKEAQSKFDKQLRLKYVHSIEEAKHGINIKPMRAYALDDKRKKKLLLPLDVQPKFDGVRCMAYLLQEGSVRLMSRGGKDYVLPHIQEELKPVLSNFALDGEIYAHGTSLQRQRHALATPELQETLSFHVYDCTTIPANNDIWQERWVKLKKWFDSFKGYLKYTKLAPTYTCGTIEGIDAIHNGFVDDGYEGAMLRENHGVYKMGAKSTNLLKYKLFKDAEFEVVSYSVGKDGIIIYTCVQADGKTFEVRPKGSDEERAELLKTAQSDVGRLLTVQYQALSDDGIPVFPVGIAFRGTEDLD